jgi:hypothetical protein
MSWDLCTSGSAIAKAGANADATLIAYGGTNKTILDTWSDEAEADACGIARIDLKTPWYSSLSGSVGSKVISKFCAAAIGQKIVNYNMAGYTSRQESLTMLNVLENEKSEAEKIIKDKSFTKFIGVSTE